jgi:hypothetical protein
VKKTKSETNIEEIVRDIVITTNDTYDTYKDYSKKITSDNLALINNYISKLTIQQLLNKFLIPISENKDGSFNYYYKKGDDDKYINTKEKSTHIYGSAYDSIASLNWVKRKRIELERVKSNLIMKGMKYRTLRFKDEDRFFSQNQLRKLLKLLKDTYVVDEKTPLKKFEKAFLKGGSDEKPKILLKKNRQLLTFLIIKLKIFECIDYSEIIEQSEIFLHKGDKPIKRIRSLVSKYRHSSDKDFGEEYLIKNLNLGLKNIFNKQHLLSLPKKK